MSKRKKVLNLDEEAESMDWEEELIDIAKALVMAGYHSRREVIKMITDNVKEK